VKIFKGETRAGFPRFVGIEMMKVYFHC